MASAPVATLPGKVTVHQCGIEVSEGGLAVPSQGVKSLNIGALGGSGTGLGGGGSLGK